MTGCFQYLNMDPKLMVEKNNVIPGAFLVEATPLFCGNSHWIKRWRGFTNRSTWDNLWQNTSQALQKNSWCCQPKTPFYYCFNIPKKYIHKSSSTRSKNLGCKKGLTAFNFSPNFPLDFPGGTRTYLGWKMGGTECTATKIRAFRVKDWEYFHYEPFQVDGMARIFTSGMVIEALRMICIMTWYPSPHCLAGACRM